MRTWLAAFTDRAVYSSPLRLRGDDLACVELATGRLRWKQRLYRGSLVLADGHLAVLSRGGKAEAPPSFAGGRVFVRNDEEIAAVTIGN